MCLQIYQKRTQPRLLFYEYRNIFQTFFKTGVLKNFKNFKGSLFSIKLKACNLFKKRLQKLFFFKICKKFYKNTFLSSNCFYLFFKHLFSRTPLEDCAARIAVPDVSGVLNFHEIHRKVLAMESFCVKLPAITCSFATRNDSIINISRCMH